MTAQEDPFQTMDAAKWARAFMEIVVNKGIEIDEGLMITWFANAIMRGYDEATYQQKERNHEVVAGALFDFAGMLTTRDEPLTFSSKHSASEAVDAIKEFGTKRNLKLDFANVENWRESLSRQYWF